MDLDQVGARLGAEGDLLELLADEDGVGRDVQELQVHVVAGHLVADGVRDRVALALGFFLLVKVAQEALLQHGVVVHGAPRRDHEDEAADDNEHDRPARQVEVSGDDAEDHGDGQEGAGQDEARDGPLVGVLLGQQFGGVGVDGARVDGHAVEEGGHRDERHGDHREVVLERTPVREKPAGQRLEELLGADHDGHDDHAVEHDAQEIDAQQFLPLVLFDGRRAGFLLGCVQAGDPTLRQDLDQTAIGRFGQFDHVRGGEGGDDGHGDDDRVDELPHDAERHAHACDDEAEFAELGEAEARVDGVAQAAAGHQDTRAGEEDVAEHHEQRDDEDDEPVLRDDGRGDHHTHGDEEDGAEEVLDRRDDALNVLAFNGLSKNGTHHEGAERGGEAHGLGQRDHAEAQADADDEQDLVVEEAARPLEDGRDDVDAHQEPKDEEERQLGQVEEHLAAGELVGDRHRGQEDHEQDRDQVLDHEGAEHHPGPGPAFQAHVVVGLEDHHRGGHRQQTAQENALHGRPAHGLGGHETQHEHAQELASGRDEGAAAHLEQLLETEFQTQTEHQEDDADLRPLVDRLLGGDPREPGNVRADEEAGEDVAQDERLLEGLGYDGEGAGGYEDDRQIAH